MESVASWFFNFCFEKLPGYPHAKQRNPPIKLSFWRTGLPEIFWLSLQGGLWAMAENEIFICFRGLLKEGASLPLIQPFSQSDVPFVKIKEQLGSVIRLLCNYSYCAVLGLLEGSKSQQICRSLLWMSCGKGRASGTVGQLQQALVMQLDWSHQSWCSAHNTEHRYCQVSRASGSWQHCNDLLRDPPSLLSHHRAPQQSQQLGLLSTLHPSPPQMGGDAEPKEAPALCILMPAPGIFIIDFIATVIFNLFFFPYSSICEN